MSIADPHGCDPAVAAVIRTRGLTRCPTACVQPTQAALLPADRAALAEHAATREARRAQKIAAANRRRRAFGILGSAGGPRPERQ
jgi:hypothetical protein